jgi:hypothetical protein
MTVWNLEVLLEMHLQVNLKAMIEGYVHCVAWKVVAFAGHC